MNVFKKRITMALVLLAGMLTGGIASATPITMDFDGLTPFTSVGSYYAGGCTKLAGFGFDCHGPDYGVVWRGATVGSSSVSPSGPAGLGLSQATMNMAAGFGDNLSFYYYGLWRGSVGVYSGLNGSGTQMAYADLGWSPGWKLFDLAFSGTARSVIFAGPPLFLSGLDNVTLGINDPVNSVPEPAALGLFSLGLLLLGLFAGLRRRSN